MYLDHKDNNEYLTIKIIILVLLNYLMEKIVIYDNMICYYIMAMVEYAFM